MLLLLGEWTMRKQDTQPCRFHGKKYANIKVFLLNIKREMTSKCHKSITNAPDLNHAVFWSTRLNLMHDHSE